MSLHILKLAVGIETLSDLANRQEQRLEDMKRGGLKPELIHVTRQTPKRGPEILEGGSIYWVIKGWITVRQALLELRPMTRDGLAHCGLSTTADSFPSPCARTAPFRAGVTSKKRTRRPT